MGKFKRLVAFMQRKVAIGWVGWRRERPELSFLAAPEPKSGVYTRFAIPG